MLKPAKRDIDPDADSHAGWYGDFIVRWYEKRRSNRESGWYVVCAAKKALNHIGPFHTSQAAFGAAKDAIDELIREGR